MPSVSRAPNIPRKIRNLKPKRQLPRNGKVNDRDDEWWNNNVGSATAPAGAHSLGATTQNELFGTRSRFARPKVSDAPISQEAAENEHENEANRTSCISTPTQLWEKFKSTPTRKKIKRFIAAMVLFTALKSIYFADLDEYQYSQTGYSAQTTSLSKKTDSDRSSLRSNVGDVKSLSELLGDDHLGEQSESYKSPTKTGGELGQNNKITGKFTGESIGRDKYGSSNIMNDNSNFGYSNTGMQSSSSNLFGSKPMSASFGSSGSNNNGNSMQAASFNSFGDKSMSDSFGSSGQSNFGSSNIDNNGSGMQSASFNSFGGKSMSDSFGSSGSGQSNFGSSNSNNGSGIPSASFNSFRGKSMLDSFGSSGQSNFGSSNAVNKGSDMQSASFNSFGSKSISESFGSSGQSNFGSSNSISGGGMQSASFNSFGDKSLSDSFGSSGSVQSNFGSSNGINGSGMQSAPFNSFGSKSMSDSFGSSGQSNFGSSNTDNYGGGMQSASFNSFGKFSSQASNSDVQPASSFHLHSDAYQQTQKQQMPNPSISQDSSGQLVQGLRGKSIGDASSSGHLSSDQFPNTKHSISNHQRRLGLPCASYGGSHAEEGYSELIYWQNIALDAQFTSPYYNPQIQESNVASPHRIKYLTFEMDRSGWNNIRLGFESMVLLAHSMGRTLVLPPKRQITHGMPDIHGSKSISFDDFYDIKAINAKQDGLNIISMEDFLEREAVNGNLNSKATGAAIYPPNNQVNWNNQNLDPLWSYISDVSRSFNWSPGECVLAFPARGTDDQHLFSLMADVLIEKDGRPFPDHSEFQGKPINVDGPTIERFREVLAGRRKICLYDSKIHTENDVIHIKAEENEQRLILPFYAFLFWEDWRQQLFALRFVRDNLVYNDAILCLAARMVNTIRDYVRQRSPENDGSYDAIHIRRGDFQIQFPSTQISADAILAGIQDEIEPGRTIYITTDERDLTFFDPLREVYDLKFIGDFGELMNGVNPQYFGLAEQIVASRSRVFFGSYKSTFSAYIVRLRGYYAVKENQPGYMSGALQNTYYLPEQWKNDMSIYQAVHAPFFAREFPIAWRDIDKF